ncbi:hypothetical protein Franean1_2557 [Parafrankia sp. EAN1pec]|uniref:hypothetical protein n=1 Tax=Parafrankia sp. (strain EAN1pec) TaxID=298653 RepID=UPI0000541117|nr:hypothetical protein Franean1_2557 [Frankia sp. EAN1pec]
MSKPADKHVMERLAFIRYMYELGIDQAAGAEPHSWAAILTLHDAVELFLGLAASHHAVDVRKDTTFLAYWKLINDKSAPDHLPFSGKMDKLNSARVAFKHHGNPPATHTIEQCRRDVESFFEAAAPVVFGVSFDDIDLAAVVPHAETVGLLKAAQDFADRGDLLRALGGLSLAFDKMVEHYSMAETWSSFSMTFHSSRWSPLSFGPTLELSKGPHGSDLHRYLAQLNDVASEVQGAMRIIALGIDFPRYMAFRLTTPRVWLNRIGFQDGMRESVTAENYRTCRRFVIESTLAASRVDALVRAHRGQVANRENGEPNRGEILIWDEGLESAAE